MKKLSSQIGVSDKITSSIILVVGDKSKIQFIPFNAVSHIDMVIV